MPTASSHVVRSDARRRRVRPTTAAAVGRPDRLSPTVIAPTDRPAHGRRAEGLPSADDYVSRPRADRVCARASTDYDFVMFPGPPRRLHLDRLLRRTTSANHARALTRPKLYNLIIFQSNSEVVKSRVPIKIDNSPIISFRGLRSPGTPGGAVVPCARRSARNARGESEGGGRRTTTEQTNEQIE